MSREEIENTINDMLDEVYEARIGMPQGHVPELHDIAGRLANLTADVLSLPDEDSILMKPLLQELRDDLETLSWEMGEISRRLRGGEEADKISMPSPFEEKEASDDSSEPASK